MTARLYYDDPACRTFEARVTRAFAHEGRTAVALDRTAFYPTSGGQPFDLGTLNGIEVVDTVDLGDEIAHVLVASWPAGTVVHGEVAWPRRFDHMQQHTGQHVLSAAFERLGANATVSFHMGAETATIDLAREANATEIAAAEGEANSIVWDDRGVTIRYASAAEAAALPLRKESVRGGTLRLIDIEGFDLSACGGTHVARTGSIGIIAVLGAEKFKGGSRITFACGGRALRSLRVLRDSVAGSMRLLSVSPPELPDAIQRLQSDAKDQRKALKQLQETVAGYQAATLLEEAVVLAGTRVLVRTIEGWDAQGLKTMAAKAAGEGGAVVALLTADLPLQIVITRSAGVNVDTAAVLRQLIVRFGGKGGGKPDLAQGGGLTGDRREIEWVVSGLIESALA